MHVRHDSGPWEHFGMLGLGSDYIKCQPNITAVKIESKR